MAKAKREQTAAGPEVAADNEAQEILVGILKSLDDLGVQLVEADWRKMTESENNSAVAWAAARRAGVKSPLPLCLANFASSELLREQAEYQRLQAEGRKLRIPVTKFCKPGYEITEEGDETVQIKVKVPDKNCSGSSALEFFGKKRCRIRFTRRGVHEWDQSELATGSLRTIAIYECEAEIPSFGWAAGDFHFSFWTDKIPFEAAKAMYRKGGSIELEVIGDALHEGDEESDEAPAEDPKPKRKPKAPAAGPKTKALPGTTTEDLKETHQVGFTENFSLTIEITPTGDDRFSCHWEGVGPAGAVEQEESSVRAAMVESVKSSIGNAVDFWSNYPGEEAGKIVEACRIWLREMELGKLPALIESEQS